MQLAYRSLVIGIGGKHKHFLRGWVAATPRLADKQQLLVTIEPKRRRTIDGSLRSRRQVAGESFLKAFGVGASALESVVTGRISQFE